MPEKVVHLESVGVCYKGRGFRRRGGFWPLKEVSFDVLKGEILGIIGRNGAGKSTLLRVLSGIILPDTGKVVKYCNKISLISLQAGFNPHLSGRENAIMAGLLQGIGRSQIKEKMKEIIDFSELGDFIDMPVKTYSAGMRARLGFAIALQVKPDVLLIDEILGVGDEHFRLKSSQALRDLIRSDHTVVLVSHQANTIKELCDRAVLLEGGKTVVQGSPEDVLGEYERVVVGKR